MSIQALRNYLGWVTLLGLAILATTAAAQTCYTAADMEAGTKSAVQGAAQQFLRMAQGGDYAGLRSAAIPALASSFTPIENAIGERQKDLQGQAQVNGTFVLDASAASDTLQRAEFYCGIFNSPDRVGFMIPNLPPGKYAFVSYQVSGRNTVNANFILQESGGRWQLAGLTIAPQAIGGHDSNWYLSQARSYKQSGATVAAYLYYWIAWKLAAPAEIQYTAARDKIADEMQAARPASWPSSDAPLILTAGGKTYRVTSVFPEPVGDDLDIIVKYQAVSDINNTAAAFADNTAVIKALLAQYPQLRQAFGGVVARAVASNGADYGTMLAMKDVK